MAACDDSNSKGTTTTSASPQSSSTEPTTTLSEQRIDHIAKSIQEGQIGSFDDYNEEDKQRIKKAVEDNGYTLEYNEDGSGTLSNEEGSWFIAKGWVDNEYTKGIPKLDFGTITMSAEDSDKDGSFYIFLIRSANVKDVSDYVKKLEKSGFTSKGEKVEDLEAGIVNFIAENNSGKCVEIGYSSNGFTYKISIKN